MTLNTSEETRYAHLAELAESETPLPTGSADSAQGSAAAAIGRKLILDALGRPEAVKKATTRARGRNTPSTIESVTEPGDE